MSPLMNDQSLLNGVSLIALMMSALVDPVYKMRLLMI